MIRKTISAVATFAAAALPSAIRPELITDVSKRRCS